MVVDLIKIIINRQFKTPVKAHAYTIHTMTERGKNLHTMEINIRHLAEELAHSVC